METKDNNILTPEKQPVKPTTIEDIYKEQNSWSALDAYEDNRNE